MRPRAVAPLYELVGGKGGVGKTTCAAALAIRAALRGERTLLVTTDPAPSLGDVFDVKLGARPRRVSLTVPVRGTLHALELDAASAMTRWLRAHAAPLERIAVGSTWLDDEDVDRLVSLSFPGIDEIAGLLEVFRFGNEGRYDRIVVDMAPTGHALRLLTMPETLGGIANVFVRMIDKQRAMAEALTGRWREDADAAAVETMLADSLKLAEALRAETTSVTWVTLAEPLAVEETADALRELATLGLHAHRIVINRVVPAGRQCRWCDARRSVQSAAIRRLQRILSPVLRRSFTGVAERAVEPRGAKPLAAVGRDIERGTLTVPAAGRTSRVNAVPVLAGDSTDAVPLPKGRLVLFGGKGGVGKTTCAAATAIAVADARPDDRVLLLSVDPAHSISDVLDDRSRNGPKGGLPANLAVKELDARQALDTLKANYMEAVDRFFDRARGASGFDAVYDRRILQALVDLAPPGLDEIVAAIEVLDALDRSDRSRADVIVVDTAPTGHALRLLEMPSLLHDWVKALMRTLLKYQAIAGLGEAGALLVSLSQRIGTLRRQLSDPALASFIVVTRHGALPLAETKRLLTSLDKLGIHVPAVVVNAAGHGTCRACRLASAEERRQLADLRKLTRRAAGNANLVVTPAEQPPPAGGARLRAWRGRWTSVRAVS